MVDAASVRITEVMYDPPGANAGHQWIELTAYEGAISLSGYRLQTGVTNHKVVAVVGTSTLLPGESIVIANNPALFAADHPRYIGGVMKSAFTLPKAGGTIVLKDATLTLVDSVAYTAGTASGDGNSLHRGSGGFVAGAPSPGSLQIPEPLKNSTSISSASPGAKSANTTVPERAKNLPRQTTYAAAASPAKQTAAPLLSTISLPHGAVAYGVLGFGFVCMLVSGLWYFWYTRRYLETHVKAEEFTIETES